MNRLVFHGRRYNEQVCFCQKKTVYFLTKKYIIMSGSLENRIVYRIRAKGRGYVFSPKHFLDFGSRDAVDKAKNDGYNVGLHFK